MSSWMDEAQYFNYGDPEGSHGKSPVHRTLQYTAQRQLTK